MQGVLDIIKNSFSTRIVDERQVQENVNIRISKTICTFRTNVPGIAGQWEIARLLTRQKSIEDIRRLVLSSLEQEKTDLHLQAEKAILEDANEVQSNQPDRE